MTSVRYKMISTNPVRPRSHRKKGKTAVVSYDNASPFHQQRVQIFVCTAECFILGPIVLICLFPANTRKPLWQHTEFTSVGENNMVSTFSPTVTNEHKGLANSLMQQELANFFFFFLQVVHNTMRKQTTNIDRFLNLDSIYALTAMIILIYFVMFSTDYGQCSSTTI